MQGFLFFDAVFVFIHAPGSNAYNPVERRMAPLSKDTAGIILPFDTFGIHLDAANKTTDFNLEIGNFKAAAKILAKTWSEWIIDNHPSVVSYTSPAEKQHDEVAFHKSEEWKAKHVRQSQYMLQIIRCSDSSCYKPWWTNYPMFFPKRFLSAPVTISVSDNDLKIDPKKGSFRSLFQSFYLASILKLDTCYDEYCPSLQERNAKNERAIDIRTCKNCSLHHSTVAALKKDKRVCQNKQQKDCLAEKLSSE